MNDIEKFLNAEQALLDICGVDWNHLLSPVVDYCATSATPWYPYISPQYSTHTNNLMWKSYDDIFKEEKDMMVLFNWFLVSKYEEGKEPIKSGFITSVDEESAREFIIRSLDSDTFDEYKNDQLALVVTEVDSWEI